MREFLELVRKAVLHRRNDIRGMKEAGRRQGGTHLNEMHACHAVCKREGNQDALYFAEFSVVDGLPWHMFRTRASVRCSGGSTGYHTVICHYRCR